MIGLHVLTIILVVTMVLLGFWQLRRHEDRAAFNDAVRARSSDAPRSPDDLLALDTDPRMLEWYTLVASGTYLPDGDFLLVNRSQDGRAGVDPVSTLRLDDGRLLLVNRGFVPLSIDVPPAPTGRIDVVGRVRASEERRRGRLSNSATGTLFEVQQIDIARLAEQLPGEVLPIYVDLLASNPPESAQLSRVATPQLTLGPHLSYTVQWFIFAGCAAVAWMFIVRRVLAPRHRETTTTSAG